MKKILIQDGSVIKIISAPDNIIIDSGKRMRIEPKKSEKKSEKK